MKHLWCDSLVCWPMGPLRHLLQLLRESVTLLCHGDWRRPCLNDVQNRQQHCHQRCCHDGTSVRDGSSILSGGPPRYCHASGCCPPLRSCLAASGWRFSGGTTSYLAPRHRFQKRLSILRLPVNSSFSLILQNNSWYVLVI